MSVQSILIVNDYLTICKLHDKKCTKSVLVRSYLNYKISQRLKSNRNQKNTSIFYLILGFLFIK